MSFGSHPDGSCGTGARSTDSGAGSYGIGRCGCLRDLGRSRRRQAEVPTEKLTCPQHRPPDMHHSQRPPEHLGQMHIGLRVVFDQERVAMSAPARTPRYMWAPICAAASCVRCSLVSPAAIGRVPNDQVPLFFAIRPILRADRSRLRETRARRHVPRPPCTTVCWSGLCYSHQ